MTPQDLLQFCPLFSNQAPVLPPVVPPCSPAVSERSPLPTPTQPQIFHSDNCAPELELVEPEPGVRRTRGNRGKY